MRLTNAISMQEAMDLADGRPAGFDYLRLVLSLAVIAVHSVLIAEGKLVHDALWDGPLRPLCRCILPMFFALSGFLVTGSMERCKTLVRFVGLRLIRIYPALAVEVFLSALVLGPIVTQFDLRKYFTDHLFFRYLLNATGDVSFKLPGVFFNNPYPDQVNGQLWTVPFELLCYVTLSALIVAGIKRNRVFAPIAAVLVMSLWTFSKIYRFGVHQLHDERWLSGPYLVASFLIGVSIYLYRTQIPHSRYLAAISVIASALLLGVIPNGAYIAMFFVAYLTVYLGTLNPPRAGWIRGADYSYGIYLYGFVIQQAISYFCSWARSWVLNELLATPAAIIFAALSWHFVEKPAFRLRAWVDWTEARYLAFRGRRTDRPVGPILAQDV